MEPFTVGGILAGLIALGTAIARKMPEPDPDLRRARFASRSRRRQIRHLVKAARQLEREANQRTGHDRQRALDNARALRTAAQELMMDDSDGV